MASSKKNKSDIKKKKKKSKVKKVVVKKAKDSIIKIEVKEEKDFIKKSDLQKILDEKKALLGKKREFVKKLQRTIQLENTVISEIEGAVITLHEIITEEKVEK